MFLRKMYALWKSTQNLSTRNIKNRKWDFCGAIWTILDLLKSPSDDEEVDYEIDSNFEAATTIILLSY